MAYDPQNPLDAITGERAKRGKKNQSTFEDRPGKPKPEKGIGQKLGEAFGKIPAAIGEVPGKLYTAVSPLGEAVGKIPGAVASIPSNLLKTIENQKPLSSYSYDVNKSAQNFEKLVTENLPKALSEAPGKIKDIITGNRPSQAPASSPGLMTRNVAAPGMGQVGVNAPTNIPPYLSGDRAALAAMERMRPQTSQRPQQATLSAAQPEQAMIGPDRLPASNRADQLRAQIASEQQAMLAARRARGGSFREDTAPLERIAGMRQELAQYERAATPGQPIRVKTPEENLATEQSLARQASDIMSKDVADLRAQVASMPAGPERDAQAERLRSLEFQQQQQAARAGALPAGAVGPQPMGASVGLSEQMLGEARARTERQREAAPRVAARQQELADVAMREGERLTGKRQDVEQQQKDLAEATRKAALSELSAPERMRQEAIATEQAKRAALTTKTGIETEESKARVAKIMSEIGVEESKARMVENQLREFYDDKQIRRRAQELDFESKSLDNELKRAQVEMQKKGMAFNPEMAAMQDAAVAKSMERLGISAADEDVVRQAAEGLKQNIDKTTYTVPSDAMQDVQRASQINDYVRGLKSLHDQGGPAAEIAKAKARRLASMFAGEITGQRASGERVFSNIGSATAAGAGIGASAGAVVGIPGGPVGVGTLAAAGAGLVGTIGLVAGTVTSAVDMVAQRIGMTSAEVEAVKSKTNEALRMLQEIAQ